MSGGTPLRGLQRLARPPVPSPDERCELCGEVIPHEHRHIVDTEARSLRCTCTPCYLLFSSRGAAGGRMKAVPDRYLSFPGFDLSPGQWDNLQIPVSVAFFFESTGSGGVVAFYPSPAGATESLLPLGAWEEIVAANAGLATPEPDVEAFLVRSEKDHGTKCFLVPIDICYELVGLLRQKWRGFDGGSEARQQIDSFFERIENRAKPVTAGLPS
jgi:hypothetical protein